MTEILKGAVIGTGFISKEHLSFLQNSPAARLVGVCDLSAAAAHYAAQRYQAEAAYPDYHQLLAETQPDVVHILTPPHSHQTIATDCLKAGAHVICEKPLTLTHADFQALWAVAQACDRHLIENQNYRFNDPILAIQNLVRAGTLGEIQEVDVRIALDIRSGGRYADPNLPSPLHRLPGGVVHDFVSHLSYLALDYLPQVDRVVAAWSNHGGGDLFRYDDLDALAIGGSVHAHLRFSCHTKPECFTFIVRGTQGTVETDLFQPYLRCVIPRPVGKQLSPLVNHFLSGWEFMGASVRNFRNKVMQKTTYEGLHRLLDKTYQALGNGTEMPIQFEQMDRTSRFIDTLLNPTHQF